MEKSCRLLFVSLLASVVLVATVHAQSYNGVYNGDYGGVSAPSWQQGGPIPLGAGYTVAPAPVVYQPIIQVSAPAYTMPPNGAPTELPKEPIAASINTVAPYVPRPEPKAAPAASLPAPKIADSYPPLAIEEETVENPEIEDGQPVISHRSSRHSSRRPFAHFRQFGPIGSSIPNMIGDSTSTPKRTLTYSYMGLQEVLVKNPNYVPWQEDTHSDVPLGVGTGGLNVNDELLAEVPEDSTGTGSTGGSNNLSREEYITTYEPARQSMAVPMAVTPTMYVTPLNISENFNADAQDRFYVDLRYFGGGESFGYAKNAGGVFTSKTDVSRVTFGIEKKITNNQSVELRLPLVLVGLKSSQNLGGNDRAEHGTEFGNLSVVYKNTWRRTAEAAFCWGVGLNAATAPDLKLRYQPMGGADQISGQIENRKWSIVPYVGFEWNRDNESFGHMVAQFDLAAGENRLDFTDKQYGLTRYRTDLKEYSLLRFNIGTGRWIYENRYNNSLFKLGVMGEIHYTTNINVINPKTVCPIGAASDSYFVYSPQKRNWSNVNLILGVPMVTPWTSLTTFVGIPLTPTRSYDIEGGISADVRF